MSEPETTPMPDESIDHFRARADQLERQLAAAQVETETRLVRAELKAEAVRAGMVDLDGLKLMDLSAARLNDKGEVDGAASMMAQLRRSKPWLFGSGSSSSTASAPRAELPRQKLATEMSDAEYRAARADLLRRR